MRGIETITMQVEVNPKQRDVRDDRYVSIEELKKLRDLVRRLDPQRLVTASFGGHDLSKRDVRDSLINAGHDFLSVHRPRNAQSPKQTEARTRDLLALAAELDRTAPVHHQEPFRRGYAGWEPVADDFLTDLRGAVAGGAAGWCFHNGSQRTTPDNEPRRSFDLRQRRLMDQLDAQERVVLTKARSAIGMLNLLPVSVIAADTQRTDDQILMWLRELKPLPKVHYSWQLPFDKMPDELLFEYVRLTSAASLSGEWGQTEQMDRAVAVCKQVNETSPPIPASIGINYSVWHRRFGKDLPPTDTGPTHQTELEYLACVSRRHIRHFWQRFRELQGVDS